MAEATCAIIIASPSPFRDSLRILLQACPQIQGIVLADDVLIGQQLAQTQAPALVVLDAALATGPDIWNWISQLGRVHPSLACITIVHNSAEQQHALAAASQPLFVGFSAQALFALIEQQVVQLCISPEKSS